MQLPVAVLGAAATCEIPAGIPCNAAYRLFMECYAGKQPSAAGEATFCHSYESAGARAAGGLVRATWVFDTPLDGLVSPGLGAEAIRRYEAGRRLGAGRYSTIDCQRYMCSARNPLRTLRRVPSEVNLLALRLVTPSRNQQACGSCWAFSTVAVMENALLRDAVALQDYVPFWAAQAADYDTMDLSEQYLLSNTFGFSHYCSGGDFTTALNYFAEHNQTVELESNFPYDYAAYEKQYQAQFQLRPRLPPSARYQPFRMLENQLNPEQSTPVVQLYFNPYRPYNARTVKDIKSYLARGIAVVTAMYVDEEGPMRYLSGKEIAYQKCSTYQSNHQVTIVGYERVDGRDCWVVKNSWGRYWGDDGLFYVPIGLNAFCIEHYAFAAIPKYYDPSSDVYGTPAAYKSVASVTSLSPLWVVVPTIMATLTILVLAALCYKHRHNRKTVVDAIL